MKIKIVILEALGWYGVVAVLAAYFLVSFLINKLPRAYARGISRMQASLVRLKAESFHPTS